MTPPARLPLLVLAATLLAAPAAAQPPAGRRAGPLLPPEHGGQTYLFRSLLRFAGVKPTTEMPRTFDQLSDLVLVFTGAVESPFPDEGWTAAGMARQTLQYGGAVLIATDRPTDLTDFFSAQSRGAITGRQVVVPRDPDACLDGQPAMPFLAAPAETLPSLHLGQMSRLRRVATNGPSSFTGPIAAGAGNSVTPLAVLPIGSRYEDGVSRLGYRVAGLVVTRESGKFPGTAVVFTDAGLFTNQMLAAADTDNFAYAYYLARYLTTGPDGTRKRTKCLFVEDGVVRTDFDAVPLTPTPPPMPPFPSLEQLQEKLTDAGNAALDDVQTSDALGRPVERNFRRIMEVLAVVAAVGVMFLVLRYLRTARHNPDLLPPPASAAEPGGSVLDVRRQAILRANDVSEPLREHLRALFAQWGAPGGGPEHPPVEATGTAADKRMLTARLRKLWEVAFGDPGPVPFARWKELEPMIEYVTRAADAGRWRFAGPGGAA